MIRLPWHALGRTFWRVGLALSVIAAPCLARAEDWVATAYISSTMGVAGNRLCVGEASRGDLGCPTYAPSLTTAGDISVTGNLSAAKFIGDGSGLTGLSASNISVTTGASGSLVYRDAYGSLVASSSLSISSTTGSVGIGAGPPSGYANGLYASGSVGTGANFYLNSGQGLVWGYPSYGGTQLTGDYTQRYIAFSTSSTEAMRIVSSGYVGIGTSTPSNNLHVVRGGSSGFTGIYGGNGRTVATFENNNAGGSVISILSSNMASYSGIFFGSGSNEAQGQISYMNQTDAIRTIVNGSNVSTTGTYLTPYGFYIGKSAPSVSASLHVSGSILIGSDSGGFNNCDTNRLGAIKYTTNAFYVCQNTSNGWEPLATSTSSTTPSISSGLSGSIVFRDQSGYLKAYNTFSISSTTGSVGIGAGPPSYLPSNNSLYVLGLVRTDTGYNMLDSSKLSWGAGYSYINGVGGGASQYISLVISATEAMRIVSTGFVGIGTTAPTAKLEVAGTISTSIVKFSESPADACTTANLGAMKVVNGKPYVCRM
jgi:hypothetical protein